MSQKQNNYPEVIMEFKKSKTGKITLKPAKGLKITLDGREVEFESAEYNGKTGEFLYVNKVDDEIQRVNDLVASGKMQQETAEKVLANLEKKREWGITSFVKAKLK